MTGRDLLMGAPVRVLAVTTRTYNALVNAGIRTVGDLVQRQPRDLLTLRGIGPVSLADINQSLADFGLSLGARKDDV